MPKRLTTDIFVEKAIKKHSDIYDYSRAVYINARTGVIIGCKNHGWFKQRPAAHLAGKGCSKCAINRNKVSIESFKKRASKKHNYFFDYSLVDFNSVMDYVDIICPIHGIFSQRVNNHLYGKKCMGCKEHGFSKNSWGKLSKGKSSKLYLIRCWNDGEEFYKVGITNNIKTRFSSKKKMPYEYEIVYVLKGQSPENIFEIEIKTKQKLLKYKYKPLIKFNGYSTECYLAEEGFLTCFKELTRITNVERL